MVCAHFEHENLTAVALENVLKWYPDCRLMGIKTHNVY